MGCFNVDVYVMFLFRCLWSVFIYTSMAYFYLDVYGLFVFI
jgi:hypothetical protein